MIRPILLFSSFLMIAVNFAQISETHPCAKHKIKAYNTAKASNHKSIPGQDKYDIHYVKLDLELDNLSTDIDAGHAVIRAIVITSIDVLILELASTLNVTYAFINGSPVIVQRFGDELQLYPSNTIVQGQEIEVEIFYNGSPPSSGSNWGGVYSDYNFTGTSQTWTLSEPFASFRWWPSKQVLTDKIDSSEVWLTIPTGMKGGSNGLLLNEIDLGNGKTRFEWKHNYNIAYYLISFAVGPYQEYSFYAPMPGTTEEVFVQNYYTGAYSSYMFEEAGDMIYVFSDLFGLYPFRDEKYGHCTAPISGGMENQTMTTQGPFTTRITSHELGHQWFGNMVTCGNWGHIWLNEGFASYSEYLYLQSLDQNQAQQNMLNVHTRVLNVPIGSVYVPAFEQDNESRIFDSRLTYDKGGALVHMIRHWVNNDDLFFDALKSYLNNYASGTAVAEDLIAEIELVTNTDLSRFLEHWYYGEGYPIYFGTYNDVNDGIVFELNQVISVNPITPFYKSHLELKVDFSDGSDTVLYVINNYNNEQYFFPITKEIDTITVDPNNWILNKEEAFLRDESLVYTSIQNISGLDKSLVEIYPNPTSQYLTVKLFSHKNTALKIFDNVGKKVFENELKKGANQLELNLAPGVYVIRCEIESEFFQEQLIIK